MLSLEIAGLGLVSRVGLGTWQFGSREWGYGAGYASGAARDIVKRALELGVTLFDSAEIYGLGKSERILGEALGVTGSCSPASCSRLRRSRPWFAAGRRGVRDGSG